MMLLGLVMALGTPLMWIGVGTAGLYVIVARRPARKRGLLLLVVALLGLAQLMVAVGFAIALMVYFEAMLDLDSSLVTTAVTAVAGLGQMVQILLLGEAARPRPQSK